MIATLLPDVDNEGRAQIQLGALPPLLLDRAQLDKLITSAAAAGQIEAAIEFRSVARQWDLYYELTGRQPPWER